MDNHQTDITIIKAKPSREKDKTVEIHLKEETLREQSKKARELFNLIQDELDQREGDIKDGLSFLDLKNDTLLSYMIDVCNIILRKVRGESISGHASVERCVEYRVILEKIKTIDQKLAYQLNKLITLPEDATEEDQRIDINNLDINLDNVESDGEADTSKGNRDYDDQEDDDDDDESDEFDSELSKDEDDEDDEDEEESVRSDLSDENEGKQSRSRPEDESDIEDDSEEEDRLVQTNKPKKPVQNSKKSIKPVGVYKPPKLRSVAYTEERDYVKGDKGRRRNHDDFYRDDDEVADIRDSARSHQDDAKTRFEEDNYTRLPDENPKKAKRKLKTKEYRKKGKFNKSKRRKR